MILTIPKKPFPHYKWRWAVYTPTEGLNDPSVFLGVLRALRRCQDMPPNSPELNEALQVVQLETHTGVNLVRNPERNIIRNSGQYWKALDLLADTRSGIQLTDFGIRVADGRITAIEFAVTATKTLELPNPLIEDPVEIARWGSLRIRPLELILRILAGLRMKISENSAFITPKELCSIVIPLAGESAPAERHVEAIVAFRTGHLDITSWPDCTPEANDRRMAREFLIFLAGYGLCSLIKTEDGEERYFLGAIDTSDVLGFEGISSQGLSNDQVYEQVRESSLAASVERQRILVSVIARPLQPRFRNEVLAAFDTACMVTRTSLPAVLEASHIIPVQDGGADDVRNGFCLRADVHCLFDSGHLRIDVDGNILLSDTAAMAQNYGSLPQNIRIPAFVSLENVRWRWEYH